MNSSFLKFVLFFLHKHNFPAYLHTYLVKSIFFSIYSSKSCSSHYFWEDTNQLKYLIMILDDF